MVEFVVRETAANYPVFETMTLVLVFGRQVDFWCPSKFEFATNKCLDSHMMCKSHADRQRDVESIKFLYKCLSSTFMGQLGIYLNIILFYLNFVLEFVCPETILWN